MSNDIRWGDLMVGCRPVLGFNCSDLEGIVHDLLDDKAFRIEADAGNQPELQKQTGRRMVAVSEPPEV